MWYLLHFRRRSALTVGRRMRGSVLAAVITAVTLWAPWGSLGAAVRIVTRHHQHHAGGTSAFGLRTSALTADAGTEFPAGSDLENQLLMAAENGDANALSRLLPATATTPAPPPEVATTPETLPAIRQAAEGVLNLLGNCTVAFNNGAAQAATVELYLTKLRILKRAAGAAVSPSSSSSPSSSAAGRSSSAVLFEVPLTSIRSIAEQPPDSFLVRSMRSHMRCLYLATTRSVSTSPPSPCVLCFRDTEQRLKWASEIRFAWQLSRQTELLRPRAGRLASPEAARSFLPAPIGFSTGRPFFSRTNDTLCLAFRAQCLTANAVRGTVSLAPLAWANAFPAIQAVPEQQWYLRQSSAADGGGLTKSGGGGGSSAQICQPNRGSRDAVEWCLSAMRAPSDDVTGLPLATPHKSPGATEQERQANLDAWRVFTNCDGGDYKCTVIPTQLIAQDHTLNDARSCQRACMRDPECDGWTHTLAGVGNMREGRCCLKKREDPLQPLTCVADECCTSGLKPRLEGGGDGEGGREGGELRLAKAVLAAAGVEVKLAPRTASSTMRWEVEDGGAGGEGVRIVFSAPPGLLDDESAADGASSSSSSAGDQLCLTLSDPVQHSSSSQAGDGGGGGSGARVGLLPCVDNAETTVAKEVARRQTWADLRRSGGTD
jgi:hypothetical protein